MSNRKVYGLAVLIGFVVGCAVGYREARDFAKSWTLFGSMAAEGGYGELAFLQYRHASPSQAREALLGFINFSESVEAMPNGRKAKTALWDRGAAYMRLAGLERKSGNTDLSQQYIHLAYESYQAAGRHVSEEDLTKSIAAAQQ
jgi:hypothetical protein